MSLNVKARSAGFTLIELLVVIFIISILIAATLTIVPKVKRAVYQAQTSAQLSALAGAIEQYHNDFKSYPGPLPNSQLYADGDGSAVPQITDPSSGTVYKLAGSAPFSMSQYNTTGLASGKITGAQNLVLGLLGGLELQTSNTAGVAITGFIYNPADIFSDGTSLAVKGPASLNVTTPKRQQAYMSLKQGDISTPNMSFNANTGGSFADDAGRCANPGDAMIPVFIDKYSMALPILYYRTNPGGTAIVGFRNLSSIGGSALVDPALQATFASAPNEIAQYDLLQNLAYTTSKMGTIASNTNSYHGLKNLGTAANFSDPIDTVVNGFNVPFGNGGNAIAYFKDPTLNAAYDSTSTATYQPSNTHLGVARQKDGYILISAGPDRLYGTRDDIIYPGPLLPQ